MTRENPVSIAIYRKHIKLFRYLNDTWIFTELIRSDIEKRAIFFSTSKNKAKKSYRVPKGNATVISRRRDNDIGQVFSAQLHNGIFETNIVSMVSRAEAFLQDAISIVVCAYPQKLSLLADKSGIPLELFLEREHREDVIRRFVIMRCEGLMFGKPSEYLDRAAKIISIQLDPEIVKNFIEIKASRDIIIHNGGQINKLYVEKARSRKRGNVGDKLAVNQEHFKHVIVTIKKLSGTIQSQTEEIYK